MSELLTVEERARIAAEAYSSDWGFFAADDADRLLADIAEREQGLAQIARAVFPSSSDATTRSVDSMLHEIRRFIRERTEFNDHKNAAQSRLSAVKAETVALRKALEISMSFLADATHGQRCLDRDLDHEVDAVCGCGLQEARRVAAAALTREPAERKSDELCGVKAEESGSTPRQSKV